jgi:hypothetical protein
MGIMLSEPRGRSVQVTVQTDEFERPVAQFEDDEPDEQSGFDDPELEDEDEEEDDDAA